MVSGRTSAAACSILVVAALLVVPSVARAEAPAVAVSPASVSFVDTVVGYQASGDAVVVTNTGTADLTVSSVEIAGDNAADFVIFWDGCSGMALPPAGTCSITPGFQPTAAGPRSGVLRINDDAADAPQEVSLSGTGVTPQPIAQLSATSLIFPDTRVGQQSWEQWLYIDNPGNADLRFSAFEIGGANAADFAISMNGCGAILARSSICGISIIFRPTAAGSRTATLSISDDAADSPQVVALSGTATVPQPKLSVYPTDLNYGSCPVGGSLLSGTTVGCTAGLVIVSNVGEAPLLITDISFGGENPSDFSVAYNTCTNALIYPYSGDCRLSVLFRPGALGSRSGTMTILSNDPAGAKTVTLHGVGIRSANLQMNVGATPNPVRALSQLTYTLKVQNLGPTDGTGVIVTDALPSNTQFVSLTADQASCTTPGVGTTGKVTCSLGTIALATTVTIKITVKITALAGTTISDTANVAGADYDIDPSNNSATVSTTVFGRH